MYRRDVFVKPSDQGRSCLKTQGQGHKVIYVMLVVQAAVIEGQSKKISNTTFVNVSDRIQLGHQVEGHGVISSTLAVIQTEVILDTKVMGSFMLHLSSAPGST